MTEVVLGDRSFGDLILEEEFDYNGKLWQSFLLVPQEHMQDLFHTLKTIRPTEAYEREREFWKRVSEATRDFYKDYLQTQGAPANGGLRRQWFQWKDFDRLEAAFAAYKMQTNQPIRLSIVAREPVH